MSVSNFDAAVPVFGALLLAVIFLQEPIAAYLERSSKPAQRIAWHYFCRTIWGLIYWVILTLFTTSGAATLAGLDTTGIMWTPLSMWIAGGWGILIAWIVFGKHSSPDGGSIFANVKDLIEATINWAGRLLKWSGLAILNVIALIVGCFILYSAISELKTISTGGAIILGALIVASAISANRLK